MFGGSIGMEMSGLDTHCLGVSNEVDKAMRCIICLVVLLGWQCQGLSYISECLIFSAT